MNILFIINPAAGKNKSDNVIPLIKKAIEKKGGVRYKIEVTKASGDAINISKKGLQDGYNTIVAVGGDGTINEVAEGILSEGYGKLGIIPVGTGNDLARSLGLPKEVHKAIDIVLNNKSEEIDVGRIGQKFFLNVGSIGFDSEIVKASEKVKKYFKGNTAYLLSLFITLIKYRNKRVTIEMDDNTLEEEILLIAIGNGKYYGGGMKICPLAELNDKKFDICVIKKISKLKLFFIFKSVFKGNHLKYNKYVKLYKSSKIRINSKDKIYLNIDGELFNTSEDTLFMIHNNKINILV